MRIRQNIVLYPSILPEKLKGQEFLTFLEENHANFIENVPLNIRRNS